MSDLRIQVCEPDDRGLARFFPKIVAVPSGCWEWTGSVSPNGYGQFWDDGKIIPAHWYLKGVRLQKGIQACHHCDNRRCVRPSHIFLGTPSENMRDMVRKGRANCNLAAMRARHRPPKGEGHGCAILTALEVSAIKAVPYRFGIYAKLARHFNVSISAISLIRRRKKWVEVIPDEQRATALLRAVGKGEG